MKPEEIRKLVGGYATGTLTPEERRALIEAALVDQELFNELARDQELKDLLEDPLARERLLGVLRDRATATPLAAWWKRPLTWSLAGGLAAAAVLVVIFVRHPNTSKTPEPVLMAKREAIPELPSQMAPKPKEMNEAPARQKAAAPVAVPEAPPAAPAEMAHEAKSARADSVARPEAATAASEAAPRAAKEEDQRRFAAGAVGGFIPVPYHVLQAGASGTYIEQPSSAVFGSTDRIRIAFDPPRDGHLKVMTGSNEVLADADVVAGRTLTVDVPPGEIRLVIAFAGAGDPSATSFEIQIRRE